jgi:hypothetical protein
MTRIAIFILAITMTVSTVAMSQLDVVVASQDAPTPSATPSSVCEVAPRSHEEIAVLLADPDVATPPATTAGQTIPTGVPVNAETAAAMEQIVRQWLACQNAGEPLRAWALFSDGYLYRLLSRQGMPDIVDAALATSGANANGRAQLAEIHGQRMLPDGRYGATVTIAYPSVPMPKTFFFYFAEIEDRLVIDGILGEISFSVP